MVAVVVAVAARVVPVVVVAAAVRVFGGLERRRRAAAQAALSIFCFFKAPFSSRKYLLRIRYVDAFAMLPAACCTDQSADADSAPSGGLLGIASAMAMLRASQAAARAGTLPELDRACFCSPLGRVTGPLETSLGWHLVLVEERIGLEMHDSGMSRVVRAPLPSGGVDSVLAPPDDDEPNELVAPDVLLNVAGFFALSYVGGQAIGSWATSIDLEGVASAVG